jgi:hypothetical protein
MEKRRLLSPLSVSMPNATTSGLIVERRSDTRASRAS